MEAQLRQQDSNCIKVVLFGPESTGKTVLAQRLAKHYDTLWVPEFSRSYAEGKMKKGEQLTEEDVLPIAIGQIKLENELTSKVEKLLICDTDLLETKVYSSVYYDGFCPEVLNKIVGKNQYNLYFLTNIDVPWEADDIRDRPNEREHMFQAFETALRTHNKPYVLLKGSEEERFNVAVKHIDNLLKQT